MSDQTYKVEKNEYRRPAIKSLKAGELIAAMGPAHASYGDPNGNNNGVPLGGW